jgi:hypothetical protein
LNYLGKSKHYGISKLDPCVARLSSTSCALCIGSGISDQRDIHFDHAAGDQREQLVAGFGQFAVLVI